MTEAKKLIEDAFDAKAGAPDHNDAKVQAAVSGVISGLDHGEIRVVEKGPQGFFHNEWVKKAILLHFRIKKMSVIEVGPFRFVDKIPLKS
ncbi:MAG: 2,3,4,5-tetrahydropyridine-2,6-dicarboxylate N-succinyltransferase, partial [Bdellovibrionota bacterium]